jgi:dihydrofolate reductase
MKLIMSINRAGIIGDNSVLPWHSTEDLKFFKSMTLGTKCLVGRTTFESLPVLPGRELIVVGKGYHTLEEALEKAPDWVIGGKSIYEQTLELCDEFHISIIENTERGDTHFDLQKIWSTIYKSDKNKQFHVRYFQGRSLTS